MHTNRFIRVLRTFYKNENQPYFSTSPTSRIANLPRFTATRSRGKILRLCWCFVMHISQGVVLRHELLWCFSLTPGPPKLLKVIFCINLKSWVFNAISPKTQEIRYSTRTVLEPLQKWSLDEYFTAKSWKKSRLRRIDWEWVTTTDTGSPLSYHEFVLSIYDAKLKIQQFNWLIISVEISEPFCLAGMKLAV